MVVSSGIGPELPRLTSDRHGSYLASGGQERGMTAIRKSESVTIKGKIRRRALPARRSPYPTNRLQAIATNPISAQAPTGIRFHQAA
jgi:hypothetical protein